MFDEIQLSQGNIATWRRQFTFFLEVPGIHGPWRKEKMR